MLMPSRRSRGRRHPKVVTEGAGATAVKASRGRTATSVQVELQRDGLQRDLGNFQEVSPVTVRIP